MLVALAGVALFSGRMWARVVGVALALLSILANFAFMPAYPLWAITLIFVDTFVIYALVVHGREMRRLSRTSPQHLVALTAIRRGPR